jgi:hypothetical protein
MTMLTESDIIKTITQLNQLHESSRVPEIRKQEEIVKDTFLGELESMANTPEGLNVIHNLTRKYKMMLMKIDWTVYSPSGVVQKYRRKRTYNHYNGNW